MTCFVPDEDVPLKANGSLNSKHLRIDYEQYKKVPRESDYDADMYRILHNWLAKQSDNQNPLAVLEFLATTPPSILKEHFRKGS
ncbi:16790_t:CDS:2 [Funneliformis mosseae]|uniref:16790_t:CDS:1 n=1 Tax=Funneliformis mosseae TaxID=27381 RepID=A0A9N9F8M6_FUNMO|nr:16790_t:CDS:2 [Funneliformis mosseae]